MSSLSHLKVLDLTNHLSGPYCASQIMAPTWLRWKTRRAAIRFA